MSGGPCDNCRRLGRYIQQLQETLKSRQVELDMLLKVWCSGGCPGGVGRFHDHEVTEDEVKFVENYAKRLRAYYNSQEFRKASNV